MSEPAPLVVLTGASGFIGRSLTARFLGDGFRVRALVRSSKSFEESLPAQAPGLESVSWSLGNPAPDSAFSGSPSAFVHLAFDFEAPPSRIVERNVEGTRLLLQALDRTPHTFRVLVSSFSAGPAASAGLSRVSAYSRAKCETERLFDPSRDLILRPGLVVGSATDGLFGRMRMQLDRGVPVPLFYQGETPVQWIHVDELVDLLVRAVKQRTPGLYSIASTEAVSLGQWMDAVARALGGRARSIRIPPRASDSIAWLLRGLERLGLRAPMSSDTVLGIKYARRIETRESLERLGASIAGLEDTLRRAM
jgi:nucleoside-diphosphate-sugar epimerase